MKTKFVLTGVIGLLGAIFLVTSAAFAQPEYLHFTRHRDSNGNLVVAPSQPNSTHSVPQEPVVRESEVAPSASSAESSDLPESSHAQESSQIHDSSETQDSMVTSSEPQEDPSLIQKTAIPSQPKAFERRNADWGMSIQEIKAHETIMPVWELESPLLEDATYRMAYRTAIEGINTSLAYTFYQDQLAQAKYVFEPEHEDPAEYVQDFHVVQDWISQAYGPPASVEEIWLDTLYQYDKSLWGQALMRGHLIMVAEWKTSESKIALVLDGGDDRVGMVADFASTRIQVPPPSEEVTLLEEHVPATTDEGPKPEGGL